MVADIYPLCWVFVLHAAVLIIMFCLIHYSYHRILLHADGNGRIMLKKLTKLMMVARGSKEVVEYLQTTPDTVKEAVSPLSFSLLCEFHTCMS